MSKNYEISLWRDYLANDTIDITKRVASGGIKAVTSASNLSKGKNYYIWDWNTDAYENSHDSKERKNQWNFPLTYTDRVIKKDSKNKKTKTANDYNYYFRDSKGQKWTINSFYSTDSKGTKKYRIAEENQKIKEEKVCVLASNLMEANQGKLINIHFKKEISGQKTLTFDIPNYYYDFYTNKKVRNNFIDLIHLKSKIKLKYDGQWYTFVVNTRTEKKTKGVVTFSIEATDLAIEELSKNGYSLNFTEDESVIELSGAGTAKELAKRIIDGTDWTFSESLTDANFNEVETRTEYNKTTGLYEDKKYPVVTYKKHYSPFLKKYVYETRFFYQKKYVNSQKKKVNTLGTSKSSIAKHQINSNYIHANGASEETYPIKERLPIYYTTQTETLTSGSVQNLIATNSEFTSYPDWGPSSCIGNTRVSQNNGLSTYYLTISNGKSKTIEIKELTKSLKAEPYVIRLVTTSSVQYDVSICKKDDTVINSYSGLSTDTGSNTCYYIIYPSNTVSGCKIKLNFSTNSTITLKNIYLFPLKVVNTSTNEAAANSSAFLGTSSTPKGGNTKYQVHIDTSGHLLKDSKKTGYSMLMPESLITAVSRPKKMFFVEPTSEIPINESELEEFIKVIPTEMATNKIHNNILNNHYSKEQEIKGKSGKDYEACQVSFDKTYDPADYRKNNTFLTVTNSYGEQDMYMVSNITYQGESYPHWVNGAYKVSNEKTRIVTGSKSNRYSLLQDVAEKFEVYVGFKVVHDKDTGEIEYNGLKPKKYVYFTDQLGTTKYSGFKEGLNLEECSRSIKSNEVVSKMYVEYKDAAYDDNGIISVSLAPANPTGEMYLLNFNHFLNTGILDKSFNTELQTYKRNLKSYNDKIMKYNDALQIMRDGLLVDQAALETAKAAKTASEEEVDGLYSEMFRKVTAYSNNEVKFTEKQYGWVCYKEYETGTGKNKIKYEVGDRIWRTSSKKPNSAGSKTQLKKDYKAYGTNYKKYKYKWYPLVTSPFKNAKENAKATTASSMPNHCTRYNGYNLHNDGVYRTVYKDGEFKSIETKKTFNSIVVLGKATYKNSSNQECAGVKFADRDSITKINNPDAFNEVTNLYFKNVTDKYSYKKGWVCYKGYTTGSGKNKKTYTQGQVIYQVNKPSSSGNITDLKTQYKNHNYDYKNYEKNWYPLIHNKVGNGKTMGTKIDLKENLALIANNKKDQKITQHWISRTFLGCTGTLKNADRPRWHYNTKLKKYCWYRIKSDGYIAVTTYTGPYFMKMSKSNFESKLKYKKDSKTTVEWIKVKSSTFKSTMEAYLEAVATKKKAIKDLNEKEELVELEQEVYDTNNKELQFLLKGKKNYIDNFESKYCNYIKEGYWSASGSYIDNDSYYYDALTAAANSSIPKVEYTLNVIDLSALSGYSEYSFDIGDETFAMDRELFGKQSDGTPVLERVVISSLDVNLDNPKNNKITLRNYTNRFEDLFQRISASVTTVENSEYHWNKADVINADGSINTSSLFGDIHTTNAAIVSDGIGAINVYTLDQEGLHLTNQTDPNYQVRLTSMGLAFTQTANKNTEWTVGMDANGINADAILVGHLRTNKISIISDYSPAFIWDGLGISCYQGQGFLSSQTIDENNFVRLDQHGLYLVQNSGYFGFNSNGTPWYDSKTYGDAVETIKKHSKVSITTEGFQYNSNPGNDKEFIKIGKLDNSGTEGIWFQILKDNKPKTVFKIDDSGKAVLAGFSFDDTKMWKTPINKEIKDVYKNANNSAGITLNSAYNSPSDLKNSEYPFYLGPSGLAIKGVKLDASAGSISIKDGSINGNVTISKAQLGPFFVYKGTAASNRNEYLYTEFASVTDKKTKKVTMQSKDLLHKESYRPFNKNSSIKDEYAVLNRSNKVYLGEMKITKEILGKNKFNFDTGVIKNFTKKYPSGALGTVLSIGRNFWMHSSGFGYIGGEGIYVNGTLYAKKIDTGQLDINGVDVMAELKKKTGITSSDGYATIDSSDGNGFSVKGSETSMTLDTNVTITAYVDGSTQTKFVGPALKFYIKGYGTTYLMPRKHNDLGIKWVDLYLITKIGGTWTAVSLI